MQKLQILILFALCKFSDSRAYILDLESKLVAFYLWESSLGIAIGQCHVASCKPGKCFDASSFPFLKFWSYRGGVTSKKS